MLTYCNEPKVGIKLLKISHFSITIIPCFLTFCSSDQLLLSFKFLIFKYSSCYIAFTSAAWAQLNTMLSLNQLIRISAWFLSP